MTSWKNSLTTAALTTGVVLVLVGCSGSGDAAPAAEPTTATTTDATDVVTPEEEPAPVPPAVGETITAEQAGALPEGQRAYTMADGSLVVIDDAAPLPTAVFDDIAAPILEIATTYGPMAPLDNDAQDAQLDARAQIRAVAAAAAAYNRTIWTVLPIYGDEGEFWSFLKSDGSSGMSNGAVRSKDEAIAQAQAGAAGRNAAGLGYTEVVILP